MARKTRFIMRSDTTINWKTSQTVPLKGELIYYTDESNSSGIKIGDGEHNASNLLFLNRSMTTNEIDSILEGFSAPLASETTYINELLYVGETEQI